MAINPATAPAMSSSTSTLCGVTLSDRWPDHPEAWGISTGDACKIMVAGDLLLTGWVDEFEPAIEAEDHEPTIRGRGRCGDLVDCSALNQPGSWKGRKLEQIAADLTKPFGIKVNAISATFFRILQRHYVPFMEMLRYQLTTRAEFERLIKVDATTLTDLERAARFLYLQRLAFGGSVSSRHFGVSHHQPGRFDLGKLSVILEELHDRLSGVVIERLPFADFIRRYDSLETLFFIDPPYWDCEGDYGAGMFSRADFEVLRDLLAASKGRFILTINDRPETRALFDGFAIEPVMVTYRRSGAPTEGRELIIVGLKNDR